MSSEEVTRILVEIEEGDETAFERLLKAVYPDLRQLAARHLKGERLNHTLQPTALLNEAYLKLVDQRNNDWRSRDHFLAVASTAMRRILLHHARDRAAQKRGGDRNRISRFDLDSVFTEKAEDLIALDDALERLAEFDEQGARIVELRFFGGLDVEETSRVLDVSKRTVERSWRLSRAWLRSQISDQPDGDPPGNGSSEE